MKMFGPSDFFFFYQFLSASGFCLRWLTTYSLCWLQVKGKSPLTLTPWNNASSGTKNIQMLWLRKKIHSQLRPAEEPQDTGSKTAQF